MTVYWFYLDLKCICRYICSLLKTISNNSTCFLYQKTKLLQCSVVQVFTALVLKVLFKWTASSIRLDPRWSYLFVCAFECEEHVDHVARDEGHGGEGHAPANPLAPGREHIVTHGKRNHLHCTKQKDSLDKKGQENRSQHSSLCSQTVWMQLKLQNCPTLKPKSHFSEILCLFVLTFKS